MKFSVGDLVHTKPSIGFTVTGSVVEYFRDEHVVIQNVDSSYLEIHRETDLELSDPSNFADVGRFHRKFDLPECGAGSVPSAPPAQLDKEAFHYRRDFLQEELDEFETAFYADDVAKQADALVDLVYVALGTAHMMNLPWHALWDAVQDANMEKVRAESSDDERSKRKSKLDVVKPAGWQEPDIAGILEGYGWRP